MINETINLAEQIEKLIDESRYEEASELFLSETGTIIEAVFLKNDLYFNGDKAPRDVYKITIKKGTQSYTFNFGQSIVNSTRIQDLERKSNIFDMNGLSIDGRKRITEKLLADIIKRGAISKIALKVPSFYQYRYGIVKGTPPSNYDILSSLTKYDPETFNDFCSEYGYDNDSIKAKEVYEKVRDEYLNLRKIFSGYELEAMEYIS